VQKIKKLLNTLYVTTPDSFLNRDGENIVISLNREKIFRIPIHNLENIVCFNYMGVTPSLMGLCAERSVGLSFVSPNGKFLARVSGFAVGNVLLRKKQYAMSDSEDIAVGISKNFITGKILNSRAVLLRGLRDHSDRTNAVAIKNETNYLLNNVKRLPKCISLDNILGVEGDSSKAYFSVLGQLILTQKETFYMNQRSRRPPKDNFNALLSFFYTILAREVESALETVGLDPYVGFLHRLRPGRPSLALDLMEELRPYMVDRFILSLINRRQVSEKDFISKESGGVLLREDSRRNILKEWQKRKQDKITHPFLDEKINIGLIPYAQALLLARFIRGDLEAYPPFFWR